MTLRPQILLLFFMILTGLSSWVVWQHHNQSDNSLPIWFDPQDSDYNSYQEFRKNFGDDRAALVAFEMEDPLSLEGLVFIRRMTLAFKKIPQVEEVISLTTLQEITGGGDELRVKSSPTHPSRLLLSRDKKSTALVLRVKEGLSLPQSQKLRANILQAIADEKAQHIPVHLSGPPLTDVAFDQLVTRDAHYFLPLSLLFTILFTALFFRNFFLGFIPSLMLLSTILWVMALYFLMGFTLNVVTSMIVPILMAVSIADSIHLILEVQANQREGLNKKEAFKKAVRHLALPCTFTALTTLAGFISFGSSSIPPINLMGYFTSLGVILALALTLFFIPSVFLLIPLPQAHLESSTFDLLIQKTLHGASKLSWNRGPWVGALFALLMAISALGMSKLKIETNLLEYFLPNDPTRVDLNFFEQQMAGLGSFEIVFKSTKPLSQNPDFLEALDQWIPQLTMPPLIPEVSGPLEIIKKMRRALHGNQESFYSLPQTREELSQIIWLAEAGGETSLPRFMGSEGEVRLSLTTHLSTSEAMRNYLKSLQVKLKERFGPLGIQTQVIGYGPLLVELHEKIFSSQVWSFIAAFLITALMMGFLFRSVKMGLISLIPNVAPIFMTLGFMGFIHLKLDVATVMIAGVSLGLTVDDTIHTLTRYREKIKMGLTPWEAISATNQSIGKAVMFTSMVLVGGFLVLCLGSFKPTVIFGAMVSLTLFISIFCEIFLVPLLIRWFRV